MEFVQLFNRAQIEARIRELGRKFPHYGDEPLVCVCVLKVRTSFADLMRSLTIHPIVVSASVQLCGPDHRSKLISKDMEVDIKDKHVLVVKTLWTPAIPWDFAESAGSALAPFR